VKSRKLLEKLNKLIGLGEGADREEIKKLRKVLQALKDKQEKLKEKLEETQDEEERRKIQQRLEVIKRQREKGVDVYKSLKAKRDL
jgi:acyl-[acyl carrier protein]--UDP-N-acetylglucosamine O-acyltransferase